MDIKKFSTKTQYKKKTNRVLGGKLTKASDPMPSECAPHVETDICSRPAEINKMKKFLQHIASELKPGDISKLTNIQVVKKIQDILDLKSESEIYTSETFRQFIGNRTADAVLKYQFKPEGPWKSTALLDNFNIDDCLTQWSTYAPKLFNKKFYNIPFQMIDFENVKTELALISVPQLVKDGYTCMGVVLNTDVSTGGGKHWFCLYCDFSPSGTEDDPFTLEFFNSSGNPPVSEVSYWLNNTKHALLRDIGKYAKIVIAAPKKLQYSNTECGVWSLMYIRFRLEDKPYDFFITASADDPDMITFRKHLFRHNS